MRRAHPDRRASTELRKGVMELYISDHPLDCLTCAANGDCELQDMAGAVGLREVRYGYDGARSPRCAPKDAVQPLLHLRRRASASSARAACAPARRCRAPSRSPSTGAASTRKYRPGADEHFLDSRVRVLRCLRAGLPDRDPDGKVGHRASASPSTQVVDHLRLLRRRLLLQGRDAGRTGGAHGARTRTAAPTRATPASRAASPGATPPTRIASPRR
jgi:hypothetical protein